MKRRIGLVGFGSLGSYLFEQIQKSDALEVDFVWNRTNTKLSKLPSSLILKDLNDVFNRNVDLIVEVADPSITIQFGELFLRKADYLIGSPTALADRKVFDSIEKCAIDNSKTIYIPSGAFWGADDVKKMADCGSLKALTVTMSKHPSAFRLQSPLKEINQTFDVETKVLYEGPVNELCKLAPNNVNTMAVACIAGHNLGFEKVKGRLVSDKRLSSWHIVEIEIVGPEGFLVKTTRKNPAQIGAVSGLATFNSFWSSLKNSFGKAAGIQTC